MRAGLAVRLDQLDRDLGRLLEQVTALGDDRGRRRPAPGRWGPIEIVEHLVLVHEGVATVLERASPRVPPGRQVSWWRPIAMTLVLRSPARVNAPTSRVLPSPTPPPLEVLGRRWREAQWAIRSSIAGKGAGWGDGAVFRHPLAGWLGTGETLQFLIDHLRHHQRQIPETARV